VGRDVEVFQLVDQTGVVVHTRPRAIALENVLGPAAIIFLHIFQRRTGWRLSIPIALNRRARR
jgi:hypothetical protein